MSLRQNGNDLGSTKASVRTFDLSVDRSSPDDYELLRFPNARTVSPINVPAEAYFRFGSKTAPQVDLREFDGGIFEADEDQSLGAVYLENPSNSGTLELFIGTQIITTPSVSVDVSSGDVNVTDRDDRDLGDVEIATSGNDINITDRDARDLGDVEIASSGNAVDVEDRQGRNIGKARLMGDSNTLIQSSNPLPIAEQNTVTTDEAATSQLTSQTATNGNNVSLDLGDRRRAVDVAWDVSGSATVTVEASHDGSFSGEEFPVDQFSVDGSSGPTSSGTGIDSYGIALQHVRARVDSNLNTLRITARGAE